MEAPNRINGEGERAIVGNGAVSPVASSMMRRNQMVVSAFNNFP